MIAANRPAADLLGHTLVRAVLVVAAASALALPSLAHASRVTTLHLGESLTVSGRTGSARGRLTRAVGLVVVKGRWNGGRGYVVTTTRTDARGRYHFTVRPRRRGWLALRIVPPDRRPQVFALHVL